jgi:hypothetical protein
VVRLARIVAMAVIIGIGLFNLYHAVIGWTLSDAHAYWQAAMRLREGADLYPMMASQDASEVYRYAPWFAWLTIPFTFLPPQVAGAIWSVILLGASGVALLPLMRARAWVLVALFLPILVGISAFGNVQALMIAWLVHGVGRRTGPIWIALAASLKVFPLLLAAAFAGRRQWGRLVISVALSAALWAPALLYDLSSYPTDAGRARSLVDLPVLYAVAVVALILVTLRLASTKYGWLAGSATVAVALPRLLVYDVTYLMLGVPAASRDTSRSASSTE